MDWTPAWLSLKLASVTTVVLLVLAPPVAWWLSRTKSRWKPVLEGMIALPLVLPPTVLGFYLLLAFAANGPVGRLWQKITGEPLAFSFSGLVLGSIIYSLPFAVQPLKNAFDSMSDLVLEVAATLRSSPLDRMLRLVLPMHRQAFLNAAALTFAHTIGEFGVVLMIGGNIPGKTQVLSIAIYDKVEQVEYAQANLMAGLLLLISVISLTVLYATSRRVSTGLLSR